jgi:hypothetical protein
MAIDFPPIRPSNRSVTVGRYPVKSFTSINGVSTARLYGSLRSNSTIQLTFTGLNDKDTNLILDSYDKSYGGFDILALPPEVWVGFGYDLKEQLSSYYTWRFNEAPTITTEYQGVFTVNVSLIGTLSSS